MFLLFNTLSKFNTLMHKLNTNLIHCLSKSYIVIAFHFHRFLIYLLRSYGSWCHDLSFWSAEFQVTCFSLLFHPHQEEDREKKQELQSHSLQNENHNHRKVIKMITLIIALCNSVKLWAMMCRATQDGQVMWRVLPKHRPLEKGMASHSSILALRSQWSVWKGKFY